MKGTDENPGESHVLVGATSGVGVSEPAAAGTAQERSLVAAAGEVVVAGEAAVAGEKPGANGRVQLKINAKTASWKLFYHSFKPWLHVVSRCSFSSPLPTHHFFTQTSLHSASYLSVLHLA